MAVKLFILGLPGSGKSAAARYIRTLAQNYGWLPERINDYRILHGMFQQEMKQSATERKKFRSTEHDGFDVLDFTVLDTALKEVERQAQEKMLDIRILLIIEFARDNYREALQLLSTDLLQDAYFLFINSDLVSCIQRIHQRTSHPTTEDDTYISEEIMRRYYRFDNGPFIISEFTKEHKVQIIENTSTLKNFHRKIYEFAETILERESYILRETEPIHKIPFLMPEGSQGHLTA